MKTLEFPVLLESWQESAVKEYLINLRTIWNIGLSQLEKWDKQHYYDKSSKSYVPMCPINWEYRRYWLDEDGVIIDKPTQQQKATSPFIEAAFSRIVDSRSIPIIKEFPVVKMVTSVKDWFSWSERTGQPVVVTTTRLLSFIGHRAVDNCGGHSCPIPQDYRPTTIQNPKVQSSGGLSLVIKKENLLYRNDRDKLLSIPYKFRAGLITSLGISWQEYDKSRKKIASMKRGKPLFKRRNDKITTLIHPNPKGVIYPQKDELKGIPYLGTIKCKGLSKRWRNPDGTIPEICTFKLCWKASGWYVQLTGERQKSLKLRSKNKAIAGDPGLIYYLTLDSDKHIPNPNFWVNREDKILNTQQQISHKKEHNLILWLNHPNTTVENIRELIRVSADDAQALLHCKSQKEGISIVGASRYQRLMHSIPQSKAITSLTENLQKEHEKLHRMRRSFAHRLSTWLVRNHQVFVCEDGLQTGKLRRRLPVSLDEQDIAVNNGQSAHSQKIRLLSDAAHGQFLQLCEQKFEEAGRVFLRYPSPYTTIECAICGTDNDLGTNYPGCQYLCSCCGWKAGYDQNPGILMLMRLLGTADVKKLASAKRYTGELAKFLAKNQGVITSDMVGEEVRKAIAFQGVWLTRTGGCVFDTKRRKPSIS